jgi:hypothetical protein
MMFKREEEKRKYFLERSSLNGAQESYFELQFKASNKR